MLVIPYSDVGWAPLFASAGAVIAESGGVLSHSSIIAREYGIPAVVSVPNACAMLDGVVVSVDGYRGEVHIHTGDAHDEDRWQSSGREIMSLLIAVCAALAGYLLGSLSFSRIVSRLVAPDMDITNTQVTMEDTGVTAKVLPMSSTTVSMHLGGKVGCAIGWLDILKVALPTLAFKLLYPAHPYELVVAVAGMIGHNWPLYYKFKGGRGISAYYGGLIVIDWLGALFVSILGMVLGIVVIRDVSVAFFAGLWLVIPWLWFRTHRWEYLAYAIAVNVVFVVAMIPDLRQHIELRKQGGIDNKMMMQAMPMGRGMLRMSEWVQSRFRRRPRTP